jgi:hypothetical protein
VSQICLVRPHEAGVLPQGADSSISWAPVGFTPKPRSCAVLTLVGLGFGSRIPVTPSVSVDIRAPGEFVPSQPSNHSRHNIFRTILFLAATGISNKALFTMFLRTRVPFVALLSARWIVCFIAEARCPSVASTELLRDGGRWRNDMHHVGGSIPRGCPIICPSADRQYNNRTAVDAARQTRA